MDSKVHRSKPVAALVATALALATGCTSSKPRPPASTTSSLGAVVAPTTAVPNDIGLRKDVTIQSCVASPRGWSALGVARNPTDKEITFTITIFFVTVPGDTVVGSGSTTGRVGPGKAGSWHVTSAFTPSTAIQCVLRGVAGVS